jgi:hypothetical protein
MSPRDWPVRYSQHPVSNPVNMHSQLPRHCHTNTCFAMLASILPSHPSTPASVELPIIRTAMCHLVIGPHVIRTMPHVNSILVQLSPKMIKLSDTCHLLVFPRIPVDIIMMSPAVLLTSIVRATDFDQFDFLPVWEIDHNAITFAYGVHLQKKLYVWNQRDEPDTMALVSSDFDKFHF